MVAEEMELTVVIADLDGFIALSEANRREAFSLRQRYFSQMEHAIRKHHGVLNKMWGERTLFFFGAPSRGDPALHALAAVQTVMEMQLALKALVTELTERNLPALTLRAGISSGKMIVGDAGSPEHSDYTVLGDRVNLAAGLAAANQSNCTQTLICGRTAELLGGRFVLRPIAPLKLLGIVAVEMAYEPLSPGTPAVS
jgi:adenylate cyclase